MEKDFDTWNEKKKSLEKNTRRVLFKTGDIWWCSVGLNVQTESCGKGKDFQRPILILKKLSENSYIGIPLSTKEKTGSWFATVSVHGESRSVLLYQVRMFHTSRFQRRLASLDDRDFILVREKLKVLLELS